MGYKIVFLQMALGVPFEQKQFCLTYFTRVIWSELDISDK